MMTNGEDARLAQGWIYLPRDPRFQPAEGQIEMAGLWLKPVFVPPSKYKTEQRQWFTLAMLRNIHTRLPSTETIIVAGYSFPPADREHLREIFVDGVIDAGSKLILVNPSNDDDEFRGRVQEIFPKLELDYSRKDFKKFCVDLEAEL